MPKKRHARPSRERERRLIAKLEEANRGWEVYRSTIRMLAEVFGRNIDEDIKATDLRGVLSEIERQTVEVSVRAQHEHRAELNQYMHAGLLLMREVMKAKIRKYGLDLRNAGMPRVGVKALAKHVDKGMLALNPESMEILTDRLVELLEAEAMKTGYEGPNDEVKQ